MKQNQDMENGTYEVIKARLEKQGADLKEHVEKLNQVRKEVFGSVETKLLGSDRIITEHNCVPRDMAPVGELFLFGYNVHIGLKNKVELSDVFSVTRYSNGQFTNESLELISDTQFLEDFEELYTYYKNTFFAKFTIKGPYFYMIFQTGKNPTDIKVFKWEIQEGKLAYIDNRSEHEVRFQNESNIPYVRATRDDQRNGAHPHISILDKVFVETIQGDLTIKIEDNTDTGKGIYSEPVEDPDQTLDDAEIYYAEVESLILLKIKPYKEEDFRYFIFNNKLKNVVRMDAIRDNCILLPGSHGIIFPQGYYLQTGEYKVFDVDAEGAVFDERISSSNGEDEQFIFYQPNTGRYLIYSYNVIEQKIELPISCNGYSHFASGEMIVFRQEAEPRKNHMIQIWQTPFVKNESININDSNSEIAKIGNKDIVNAMAACKGVIKLIEKKETYQSIYEDIVKECQRICDSYFWLKKSEVGNLCEVLMNVKETATHAIGEFEKVVRIKAATKKAMEDTKTQADELLAKLQYGSFETIDEYVAVLSKIRTLRGNIASLKDLRYIDMDEVSALDEKVRAKYEKFANTCVQFLLEPTGLKPHEDRVNQLTEAIAQVTKSMEGKELEEKMNEASSDLEVLIDIVSNFKIEDPTVTTEIIEKISVLFSKINNSKARLVNRINDMTKDEMKLQFASQMKLLGQSVVNYLDISDSAVKCDEYLNKVMIMIQELEGRFAEFDEYVLKLGEKREELYTAFESKKQAILEKQNRRLMTLVQSAERILSSMAGRLKNFTTAQEINGYLATDLMVEKVRDIIAELTRLQDTVKADEVTAKLKKLKEDALRELKDRQELYLNGDNVITLGRHHFSVNTKEIDLSIVQRENALYYHITGTDFWDPVDLDGSMKYQSVFNQSLVSENQEVYRGEYLAYLIFMELKKEKQEKLVEARNKSEEQLLPYVQKFMEPRYQENYTKGVHDLDATKLLKVILESYQQMDLLAYSNETRAVARLYWQFLASDSIIELLCNRLGKLMKVDRFFHNRPNLEDYLPMIMNELEQQELIARLYPKVNRKEVAEYLCQELMKSGRFIVSTEANTLYEGLQQYMRAHNLLEEFQKAMQQVNEDVEGSYYFAKECLKAYLAEEGLTDSVSALLADEELEEILKETIVLLLTPAEEYGRVVNVPSKVEVSGLIGTHPLIEEGRYQFRFTKFMAKLQMFADTVVPLYEEFASIKKELATKFRAKLHLDDFKPQVLSSFVRNRLIDKVYLPLIGDNLAKQIGEVGENKRTDLMGLLLLLSPPGYGKTTLMEYIASRLGIILVKINGPSLGHEVTSLDPALANNIGAKEELVKLNVALKMGNNVMIYIDDIQHCNPEFLQKFISLCDGQRKIDGVYNGVGQTFDLRGKKVAVVMAGNPYTESGEKFKIPDMLANRADVYNLGDMLRENESAFELSYIENCMTSNPILSKLTNTSTKDLYSFVDIVNGASQESVTFEGTYSMDEINEYQRVIERLNKVRDLVLKVNMEYIHSAACADEYRNEPPFKLQGSYRNMNKIAEKVVPIMNEEELFKRIQVSYENDAQTLTKDAEANLLKWKEIAGCMTEEEEKRYQEIKRIFLQNRALQGKDQIGRAVQVLSAMTEHLEQIKEILGNR